MDPKPFQKKTVEAAVRALVAGSRRFLLADEVGLGKTIVAREIIRRLAKKSRDRPLRVFYFASGQTVAAQNAPRLFSESNDERSTYRLVDASRPSLLPMADVEDDEEARVHIFRFTPHTALPGMSGRGRGGVAQERALLRVLLTRGLQWDVPRDLALRKAFVGGASEKGFARAVRLARTRFNERRLLRGYSLRDTFRDVVRHQFGVAEGEHLAPKLANEAERDPRIFVARLRLALAEATLRCLPPDLIIFDEFHRYREKAFALPTTAEATKGAPERNVLSILPSDARPAVLLLSATPFRLLPAKERARSLNGDADDFYRLVGFLHGDGAIGLNAYEACRTLFFKFEQELAKNALDVPRLLRVREQLEEKWLRPRIARTERAGFLRFGGLSKSDRAAVQLPTAKDLDLFVRFARGLRPADRACAIPYWRSVPLPHQALGRSYQAWDHAFRSKWKDLRSITKPERERLRQRSEVPHIKLRGLLREFPPELLALPWLPPSQPWWPLRGAWQSADGNVASLEKGLLFSRFRAVPPAVAGLVSFAVEEWAARRRGWHSYRKVSKQSFLAPKSLNVVSLFHPSVWLAECVDPVTTTEKSTKGLMRQAMRALRRSLPEPVKFDRKSDSRRPVWKVLSMLERAAGVLPMRAVWRVADQGKQIVSALSRIDGAAAGADTHISPEELRRLAWFALTAPGVVLLRSVKRYWPEATAGDNIKFVADLSWNGLRPYLDQPWFVARLSSKRQGRPYPQALQDAVVDGNLEAVLDEHFWMPTPDSSSWLSEERGSRQLGRLEELRHTLGIRSAQVSLVAPSGRRSDPPVRLSAHAALPLTDTVAKAASGAGLQQLRADDLRRAFNTPFWPHLLCTTSVGQEGLDFHVWCRTVVHWDLCASPVDLEQREGRVDRFKSLAVRRAVAERIAQSTSLLLWKDLGIAAESCADAAGLAPWWIFDGAIVRRIFLDPPASDERSRRERLEYMRDLYRLVLGLPHQADVLQRLAAIDIGPDLTRSACLDLGAWRTRLPQVTATPVRHRAP